MAELIMRELTALDPQTGLISETTAREIGVTLRSWASITKHNSKPMIFVFQRGPEITIVSHDEAALTWLLDAAKSKLAEKGLALPPLTDAQWRPYDAVGRLSYEGENWCKLAFRTAGETNPKRYFGMDDGWSLCGCERDDLDRVLPGLSKLYWAWYDATGHKSMKGYWLEF